MTKIITAFLGYLFFLFGFCYQVQPLKNKTTVCSQKLTLKLKMNFLKSRIWSRTLFKRKNAGRPAVSRNWMVVTANPYASDVGANILRRGGTAADALVAVQAVLGLVEPQSSGMGGGGFLIWYDAESGKLTTLDGREVAPMAADESLFQDEGGEPLKFWDAVIGGRSVGVPGMPALLEVAHSKWGKKLWTDLFKRAIELAEDGFIVSDRLSGLLADEYQRMSSSVETKSYFFPNGKPLAQGDVLVNREYANLLRKLADRGSDVFYFGPIADAIVNKIRDNNGEVGLLDRNDLANYAIRSGLRFVPNSEAMMFVGWGLLHQERLVWVKFWE